MNTNFVRYDNDVTDLEVGDMVKVTRMFDNPYCHRTMDYNADLKRESFWTEVLKLSSDGTMKVRVSNNCSLSDTNQEQPLKFKDTLVFQDTGFIKEHKKNIDTLSDQLYATLEDYERKELIVAGN